MLWLDRLFGWLGGLHIPTLSEWLALLSGPYAAVGYPLVLLAAMLENTVLVTYLVPGGTMLLLAGIYAGQGVLDLPSALVLGWIGTFLGASIDYSIGRWGERTVLRALLRRPSFAGVLGHAGAFLRRYGLVAILVSHFVPQVRALVAVAAGMTRLPYARFALFEAPAALAWASVYILGGYWLADQIPLFEMLLQRFGSVLAVVGLSLLAARLLWPWIRRRRTPPAAEREQPIPPI